MRSKKAYVVVAPVTVYAFVPVPPVGPVETVFHPLKVYPVFATPVKVIVERIRKHACVDRDTTRTEGETSEGETNVQGSEREIGSEDEESGREAFTSEKEVKRGMYLRE